MIRWIKGKLAKRKLYADISNLKGALWLEDPRDVKALLVDLEDLQTEISANDLLEMQQQAEEKPSYYNDNGTAVIPIHGHILPSVPFIFDVFGIQATGMDVVSGALQAALEDPEIKQIELDIDSPGGSAKGVPQVGEQIKAVDYEKPVLAHASGNAGSAAYWLGSQARQFTASKGSEIGSIGTYSVYEDTSKQAEAQGRQVHVISSGGVKGVGVDGAPITASQLAGVQEELNAFTDLFVNTVASGRKMDPQNVRALANGKMWLADEAKNLGLIDAVISPLDQAESKRKAKEAMEKKELEEKLVQMKADLDRMQAEKEAAEKELQKNAKEKKEALIDAAVKEGKIPPKAVNMVKRFAGDATEKEIEEMIADFGVQVRSKPVGESKENSSQRSISDSDKAAAKLFGLSDSVFQTAAEVESVSSDGYAIMKDGSRKPMKEVFGG